MKGYYINLERSTERRASIEASFLGSQLIRFNAIEPKEDIIINGVKHISTVAGCFLSHQAVWELIVSDTMLDNQDWVLVAEDDIQFDENVTFNDFAKKLDDDIYKSVGFVQAINVPDDLVGLHKPETFNRFTTALYFIRKAFAQKLLEITKGNIYIADMFGSYFPEDSLIGGMNTTGKVAYSSQASYSTINGKVNEKLKTQLIANGLKLDNWLI